MAIDALNGFANVAGRFGARSGVAEHSREHPAWNRILNSAGIQASKVRNASTTGSQTDRLKFCAGKSGRRLVSLYQITRTG